MPGLPYRQWPFWSRLALQLILVWAVIFGVYEMIEQAYLQSVDADVIRAMHLLRGSLTAFLLAWLGARGVYQRREAFIVEAKERLAADKTRQDQILAELGAGLVVLDGNFRVVYANPQAQKWLGTKLTSRLCISEDCAMGKSTGICPARESRIRTQRVAYEEKVETPEGLRHLYITATPMPGTNGNAPEGFIELIQDITPLKEMETRLRQSLAAARVGAVASGVAHQIGNPLAAVSAAVERLYSLGAAKHESYARYLRQIEAESDRAVKIIRSLMDLARRVGVKRERADDARIPADISVSVMEAVDAVAAAREMPRERIKIFLPDNPLAAQINPVDIREVLINLLNNALDATARIPQPRVAVHASEEHGRILVMVCDNGLGVDAAANEKIFEPFYTTRRDGLGLGLFLCRELVESAGGEVWADNLPAGGARFLIRLPMAAPSAVQ